MTVAPYVSINDFNESLVTISSIKSVKKSYPKKRPPRVFIVTKNISYVYIQPCFQIHPYSLFLNIRMKTKFPYILEGKTDIIRKKVYIQMHFLQCSILTGIFFTVEKCLKTHQILLIYRQQHKGLFPEIIF